MKVNLILFFIALIGLFFLIKPMSAKSHSNFQMDKAPQEYMIQAFVTSYTEEGLIKNQMSAKYWAYLPLLHQSTLVIPHLVTFKADGSEWHVDAKQGSAKQPNIGVIEQIDLWDTVVLQRKADLKNSPILVETQTLKYQPKEQYAESESAVTMTKPDLRITGIGLRAFLEQNSVELLHNVKTHCSPTAY